MLRKDSGRAECGGSKSVLYRSGVRHSLTAINSTSGRAWRAFPADRLQGWRFKLNDGVLGRFMLTSSGLIAAPIIQGFGLEWLARLLWWAFGSVGIGCASRRVEAVQSRPPSLAASAFTDSAGCDCGDLPPSNRFLLESAGIGNSEVRFTLSPEPSQISLTPSSSEYNTRAPIGLSAEWRQSADRTSSAFLREVFTPPRISPASKQRHEDEAQRSYGRTLVEIHRSE